MYVCMYVYINCVCVCVCVCTDFYERLNLLPLPVRLMPDQFLCKSVLFVFTNAIPVSESNS